MEKLKLTQRVYEQLYADILSEKYNETKCLPGIQTLCLQYQVGRNTMRHVLARLEKEKMIFQSKGKPAQVNFNIEDHHDHTKFIQELQGKAPIIRDVFTTMEYVLPELTATCLQHATKEHIVQLKEKVSAMKYLQLSTSRELLDCMIDLYSYVLTFLNNPFADELFRAFTEYVYIAIPPSYVSTEEISKVSSFMQKTITKIFEFITLGNQTMMKNTLRFMLGSFAKSMDKFMKRYQDVASSVEPTPFCWEYKKLRNHLYLSVADDVIRDIEMGIYQNRDGLLSIEQMSKRYCVSAKTIRKALEVLREYDIVSSINGVGSFINIRSEKLKEKLICNENTFTYMKDYVYAVQLLLLCVKGIKKPYFRNLTYEMIDDVMLSLTLEEEGAISSLLTSMFSMNSCLHSIYRELDHYLQCSMTLQVLLQNNMMEQLNKRKEMMVQAFRKNQYRKVQHILVDLLEMLYQNGLEALAMLNQ